MSPQPPPLVALYEQLTKAHHRIRELKAHEAKLFAQNRRVRCHLSISLTKVPSAPPSNPVDSNTHPVV